MRQAPFLASLPRRPSIDELQFLLGRLLDLRTTIVNLLNDHDKAQNMCAKESQNERHIQDSQTQSISESETSIKSPIELGRHEFPSSSIPTKQSVFVSQCDPLAQLLKPNIPLDIVLRACPEIHPYGPGGSIRTWRDFVAAAAVLRPMLQISSSAFHEACVTLGPENTGVAIAYILEKGATINSAGGHLRNLTKRASSQQFTVKPMVAALLKSKATTS